MTIVDPSQLDFDTGRANLAADPELADRFPSEIAGKDLQVTTMTADDWLTQIGAGRRNKSAKAVQAYVRTAGKEVADLSMGFASYAPSPGNVAALAAVRTRGSDGASLTEAVIPLLMRSIEDPVVETIEVAAKSIRRVTDAATPGQYPRYAYGSGDTVWVIDAEGRALHEIVAALP